jgi:predicted O-methyltransferase YrrM
LSRLTFFANCPRIPLVPFAAYRLLGRLRGRHPERRLLQLSSLVGQRLFSAHYPYIRAIATSDARSPASICDHTGAWLWWYLTARRPRIVVEFGTGYSSAILGAFAQHQCESSGHPTFILSAEHDPEWHALQSVRLRDFIDAGLIQLPLVSLETQSRFGRRTIGYSRIDSLVGGLSSDGKADLVFVDGPPAVQHGGVGREGAILQAIALVRQGGLILVHDALRQEEFSVISRFHADPELGLRCKGIVPLWYGLAVCEKQ